MTGTYNITAGPFQRTTIRYHLLNGNYDFKEERGWFWSTFHVTLNISEVTQVMSLLKSIQTEGF